MTYVLTSILRFHSSALRIFQRMVNAITCLNVNRHTIVPRNLRNTLTSFRLRTSVLIIRPTDHPLRTFRVRVKVPSALYVGHSVFVTGSSGTFLSGRAISVAVQFCISASGSCRPRGQSLIIPMWRHVRRFGLGASHTSIVIPTTRVFLVVTNVIGTRCVRIPIVNLTSNVVSGLCTVCLGARWGRLYVTILAESVRWVLWG